MLLLTNSIGRARVEAAGLAGRIELREGSATDMPLPDACCDVVTAVECAFHFETRARFLSEAFRVLRPGGRLVASDILPNPPDPRPFRRFAQRMLWTAMSAQLAVPTANAWSREEYAARLRQTGFDTVQVDSIRTQVYPGW